MSSVIENVPSLDEKKSLDKKEIEVEEREKMLNAENKSSDDIEKNDSDMADIIKPSIEPVSEEGREVKPKYIPIGGIKMPGFFTRSKSKEKCKDGDDGAQGELLEKPSTEEVQPSSENAGDKESTTPKKSKLKSLRIPNPFANKQKQSPTSEDVTKETEVGAPGQKKGLLNAIRLPLANMIPRKLRSHGGTDPEMALDSSKTAELASMETLDDNKDIDKVEVKSEDGMETVKLDVEDKIDDDEKQNEKLSWRERIRQQKFLIHDVVIASGVAVFIMFLITIIAFVCSGGSGDLTTSPIKDGQYVDAVTSCGFAEGILEDGAIAFRGIPYALPPVGENRWEPAKSINKLEYCWNGRFKAHNATPACTQIYGNGTVDGIEDCLTLDVITPDVRYDNPLPVIVLIGSNSMDGGTPGKLRPSTRYARSKDVVFVRPNFRVGILGFLSIDLLTEDGRPNTSGNYGLSDIIAALKWVQLNIKNFGGDPTAVTLFGHRSGATLVTALLTYKKSKSLFARAWVSSGSALFPAKQVTETSEINKPYMDLIKCKDASCLRKSSVDDIINSVPDTWRSASPDLPYSYEDPDKRHTWLVKDGYIISGHTNMSLLETEIPLVIGTTAQESDSGKLFNRYTSWTPELVAKHINDSMIGQLGLTKEALDRYNATYQGLAAMISDIRTVCPLYYLAKERPSIPFYVVTQGRGDNNIADVDSDVSAILGRYEPKTPEQRRYVAAMQQLFYHYVWHGDVPQANNKNNHLVLTVGQDVLPTREYPNCDFWLSKDVVPKYGKWD